LEISLQKDARACYRILKVLRGATTLPNNGTEEDRPTRTPHPLRPKPAKWGRIEEVE
jgi:hypothetical protein